MTAQPPLLKRQWRMRLPRARQSSCSSSGIVRCVSNVPDDSRRATQSGKLVRPAAITIPKPRTVMPAASRKTPKSKYRDILFEVKDQVAWVTINRPRVLNAFREQPLDEMIDALKSTREDPSIVCVVITGAGDKAF